jgi:hypothetical protein
VQRLQLIGVRGGLLPVEQPERQLGRGHADHNNGAARRRPALVLAARRTGDTVPSRN